MGQKIYQHRPLQDPRKFTQILIFWFENKPSGNPWFNTIFCRNFRGMERKSWNALERPTPGLPDGIFSYQNSEFWYNFEVLEVEKFDTFRTIWNTLGIPTLRSFDLFLTIWYILRSLVKFSPFWYMYCTKKIWQPCPPTQPFPSLRGVFQYRKANKTRTARDGWKTAAM
jgi:hypothetical protein